MSGSKRGLVLALVALWALAILRPIRMGLIHSRLLFRPSAWNHVSTWKAVLDHEWLYLVVSTVLAAAITVIVVNGVFFGQNDRDKKVD